MTVKLQYRLYLIFLGIPGLYCQESNTSHQQYRHQNESPLVLWFFQLITWTVFIHSTMFNHNWMFCGFIQLYCIEFTKYVMVLQKRSSLAPPPSFDAFYTKVQSNIHCEKPQKLMRIPSGSVPILRTKKYSWISSLFMLAITTSSMVDLRVLCHQNVEWKTMTSWIFLLIQINY